MAPLKRMSHKRDIQIHSSFRKDCENLLRKYHDLTTFSYSQFSELWKEMSFSSVYKGTYSCDEQRHFTEIFFFEAKKFLIYGKSVHMQIGAFYLLYGLYYKQPLKNYVKIRLTKQDFSVLKTLLAEMRDIDQLEVLCIYSIMKTDDVFEYVFLQSPMAPDLKHLTEDLVMEDNIYKETKLEKLHGLMLESGNNDELKNVAEVYRRVAKKFTERIGAESLLALSETDVTARLKEILDINTGPLKHAVSSSKRQLPSLVIK